MSKLAGKLHVTSLRGRLGNELATFDAEGRLRVTPTFKLLKDTVAATKAKLVVLDNSAHLFTGNENDRGQVTAFINLLYSLCLEFGATVILVAHFNKVGDSYSGSTAWLNAVRSQVTITRPENSIDPDERVLSLGKANYARPGETLPFRWLDFALVTDADIPAEARAAMAATLQASADNAVFLSCLDERNRQGRPVSEKTGSNFAPAVFSEMPESKAIGNARLRQAMDRLFRINAIERGVLGRDTSKGRDIVGLRRFQDDPQTPPPSGSQTHPQADPTRAPDAPQTPPHTHAPLKGGNGAASWAAAPHPDSISINGESR